MGIHHVGTGVVTGAEIIEACRASTQLVQNTENFHYEFIDFSGVSELQISESDLQRIIAQDFYAAIFRPEAVIVIVAPRDDIFETMKEWDRRIQGIGWLTHIARERAEAERWLQEHYPSPSVPSEQGAEKGVAPSEPPALA